MQELYASVSSKKHQIVVYLVLQVCERSNRFRNLNFSYLIEKKSTPWFTALKTATVFQITFGLQSRHLLFGEQHQPIQLLAAQNSFCTKRSNCYLSCSSLSSESNYYLSCMSLSCESDCPGHKKNSRTSRSDEIFYLKLVENNLLIQQVKYDNFYSNLDRILN